MLMHISQIKTEPIFHSSLIFFIPALVIVKVIQPSHFQMSPTEMFPEMQITDSEHDWILLNVNMTGYYRVNYDPLHLKRIAQLLEKDPKVR